MALTTALFVQAENEKRARIYKYFSYSHKNYNTIFKQVSCFFFVTSLSFDDQNGNLKWIFDGFIYFYEEHITEVLVLSNLNWCIYLVDGGSQSVIKPDCYPYYILT